MDSDKVENVVLDNFDSVFRQKTRGGSNEYARFFCAAVFPQYENIPAALEVECEQIESLFALDANPWAGICITFNTRADFAKFPALFRYVHERGGHLILRNWDRDAGWKSDEKPSDAPDSSPVFWAILAAAQMYYKE